MSKRNIRGKNTGGRHRAGPPKTTQVCWEELSAIQSGAMSQFGQIDQLEAMVNNTAHVPANHAEIQQRHQIIKRDVQTYRDRLAGIAAQHEGRTGVCRTPDDAMALLQIGEAYQNWMVSFSSVVLPNVEFILNAYSSNPNQG